MKIVAAIVVLASVTGCVQAHRQVYTAGDAFQQKSLKVSASGFSIPLPEGNWIMAGFNVDSNNTNAPIAGGTLLRVTDGAVTGMIHYNAPQVISRWGYVKSSFCKRDDILHITVNSNFENREQDCWGVNHLYMSPNTKSAPEIKQAWEYIIDHKLKFPTTMISVRYRLASTTKMLNVMYAFNPEIEGISPATSPKWSESGWHRARINFHPDRLKYVEKIKKWASEWYLVVKSNFERRG